MLNLNGLLAGFAMGYIAFTENGRKLGNTVADFAVKNGKPVIDSMMKKGGETNDEN